MGNSTELTSWRTPPPSIPESEITGEYSADVVIIGLGNAGTPAVRAAAEAGASVIALEKMKENRYQTFGNDVGHINSKFLTDRGVPKADPIELFNEWMIRSGNRANPNLVMQFCQKCGETFDWYTEPFTPEQMDNIRISFWNPANKKFSNEVYLQKFWVGTAQFSGLYYRGNFSLTDATRVNQARARELGADLHFGTTAQQLILDGDRVTGVIATNGKGQYVKYNAKKGVILAAGDFGGSQEMMQDLLPDVVDIIDEGKKIRSQGRDGSGIRMGVWAGGRLEARPLATMGGNTDFPMGTVGNFGGVVWINEKGQRFCNEGFGDPVFSGFPGAQMKRQNNTIVFDSSVVEDIQMSPPSHMAFWFTEDAEKQLREAMAGAVEAGAEGYGGMRRGRVPSPRTAGAGGGGPEGEGGPPPEGVLGDRDEAKDAPPEGFSPPKLYAANTFAELADYVGFKGDVRENFLDTIKRYNEFCASGRDEDFGKGPKLLNALDKPPYFVQQSRSGGTIGFFLVTVGGLLTDEYQNVLNQKREPIPGLYATGNCCGRRFGTQYSTPIPGVSIGIAVTLGREVGRIVAEL